MKFKIIFLLVSSALLGACGSDNDDDGGVSPKAIVPADSNGDTTLYLEFVEEDPVASIDLLEGVDLQGKQGFATNIVCQLDPETGETKLDEEDKEILIPEGGLFTRAQFMEIDPSVWANEVKYTLDGPEEIIYTCTYSIENFAFEEVETETDEGTVTEVLPVSVDRNVEIKIIAKEHLAEEIVASHSEQIEVPLSLSQFQFKTIKVLPVEASIKNVEFSSDNTDVLEIDEVTGIATLKSEGTATVTIATMSMDNPIAVTRIVNVVGSTSKPIGVQFLNSANEPTSTYQIQENTSSQLNVEVLFQEGVDTSSSNKTYRFESLDENMLTIDENGLLTAAYTVGTGKIAVFTDEQEFVTFLTVEVIGDPSVIKLHNSDFESGIFGEAGDWQTYEQVVGGSPQEQSKSVEINAIEPLDGNYDVKVISENVLRYRQSGIVLRFYDSEERDEEGAPVIHANSPPFIGEFGKDTTYVFEYRTSVESDKANNSAHVRIWHQGTGAVTPTSADDPYFNTGQSAAKILWGALGPQVNKLKQHEFTISGRKKLYQIVLFANNTSAGIDSLEWNIDNIRFYKKEEQ